MRRIETPRNELTGLLTRPPASGKERTGWADLVVDVVGQLEALASLRDRGLLSPDEFEWQRTKALEH